MLLVVCGNLENYWFFLEVASHVMMTKSKISNVFTLYREFVLSQELVQLALQEWLDKARNEVRRRFEVSQHLISEGSKFDIYMD